MCHPPGIVATFWKDRELHTSSVVGLWYLLALMYTGTRVEVVLLAVHQQEPKLLALEHLLGIFCHPARK